MRTTTRLRQLIAGPEILLAPGAYDGITARLIEQAGYSALYMTGAGTAASFGLPDYGLLTMTEMVGNAARITAAAFCFRASLTTSRGCTDAPSMVPWNISW